VFQQFSAPITYTAGTGLSESPSYTFNIANTGTAGTYGSASQVPVFVTNAQGQVTSVTNTNIAINGSAVSGNIAGSAGSVANALTLGTYLTGGSFNGSSAVTATVDATTTNTASKVVARDSSGNFAAGTITAALSGNATSATNVAGGAANQIVYNTGSGTSAFITAPSASGQVLNWNGSAFNYVAGTISGVALGSNLNSLTAGTFLVGTAYNGSGAQTWTVDATSANTASKVVARDASGNFSAGTITAALSGNATTATTAGTITNQANSATITAASTNTANQIVLRDGSGNFSAGTITAALNGNASTATSATTSGSTTGNAATATALQTARTIGGVSFNGTANIDLPGVNISGNQNTSGNAATATSASQIDGIEFRNGNVSNPANPDTINDNGIGYVQSVSLFGQTDGALYSQAYSSSWVHQIFGDYRTGQLAVRGRNSGTLTAWRVVLDSTNYTSYAPTLTGGGASGTWGISISGNATTATTLSSGQSNWVGTGVLNNVVGLMAWKNYGNGHVIFDASAGTAPNGGAISNTNATVPWTGTYPTLMGWNGASTYGVRVDSARVSDNTSGNAATATALQTARNIGGVSFNGTADINLPGVNTAGNQNTSGNAATATTATTANALNTANNYQVNSLGVGVAASGTAGEIRATNNVIAFFSSDIKFKENVRDIPNAAATATAIGGKLFDWTDAYLADHGGADEYFVQKEDFGVIAQDVQKVFPIAVRTRPDGSLAVDYEKLSALALAAIAEQEDRIAKLEAMVAKLIEG
jgi:hypothetical protein